MSDVDARIEALAEQGIHRVGDAVFEKTHLDSTRRWVSATVKDVLDIIEDDLLRHPGIFGHTISRSDNTQESVDLLREQAQPAPAAEEAPAEGAPAEPEAPAAPEAPAEAPAAPPVDSTGPVAETPGETAEGRVGTEADAPEAQPAPAPEGAIQS